MATKTVHLAEVVGQAPIGEQDGDLMQTLRAERPEIPHRSRAAQIGLGVALLRANKVGEFVRISDEEDRGIVADQVPITLLGVELHRKAAHVALGIGGTPLAGYCRKAQKAFGLFTDLTEQLGLGVARDVTSYRQRAVGAGPLGMHHPSRDPLAAD